MERNLLSSFLSLFLVYCALFVSNSRGDTLIVQPTDSACLYSTTVESQLVCSGKSKKKETKTTHFKHNTHYNIQENIRQIHQ